jgi:hypothetical protein
MFLPVESPISIDQDSVPSAVIQDELSMDTSTITTSPSSSDAEPVNVIVFIPAANFLPKK